MDAEMVKALRAAQDAQRKAEREARALAAQNPEAGAPMSDETLEWLAQAERFEAYAA